MSTICALQQFSKNFSEKKSQINQQTCRHSRRSHFFFGTWWWLFGKLFCLPHCFKALFGSGRIWSETNPKEIARRGNGGWSACAAKLPNHRAFGGRTIPYNNVIVLANRVVFQGKRFKSKHDFVTRFGFNNPCANFIHRVVQRIIWCLYDTTSPFDKSATVIWKKSVQADKFSFNLCMCRIIFVLT